MALLVIATGWVSAAALTSALGLRDQALRSRHIREAADEVRIDVLQAETAQRGYLLTMDKAYLGAYQAALARPDPVEALRIAFGGKEDLQPVFQRLATTYDEKLAEMAHAIEIADHEGVDTARRLIADGKGQRLTEAIRFDLDEVMRREKSLRDEYSARVEQHVRFSRAVVLSGTLIAFALAVLVNLSLMSAVRAREAAQRIMEAQSVKLGQQTESLLEHEKQLGEQLGRQQELSQALQRTNEELDQFAYATSHDLKAPLRGIMNLATFIEEDLGADVAPSISDNLKLLRGRAVRLEALIEGILAYSRAGRIRSHVERVDTAQLARDVVDLIAAPSGCAITIAQSLPTLLTERVPLQQVLMNLVQNAIKHGCPDAKGSIEIGYEKLAGRPTFYIKDAGPGIAPHHHEKVFGIFQTLAPRDKVEGTGIGLAVVKKLVESRGGKVEVHSTTGQGARFGFVWPAEVV
ncbi:MAG: ATP-binding protein [Polyangia bacterium]